ncbi:Riboflavin kinase / FMN adenylyltransferase [invertebrate metagenome]|uniref:Bifunctional riboflavin kinase/FMN adenylyltransferase n=1 Tax=invertebrate metagenome TaxID=1711999 RepID=A0A484H5T9_9ZZZZ
MTMRLFRHYTELPTEVRGSVVVLGNFDGVHLGHQAVIATARDIGLAAAMPVGVMTFEPHPRAVLAKDKDSFRLTPFRTKARTLEALGVDFLIAQHFDLKFARHTAAEFVDHVLVEGIGARHVVVGYDYLFGQGRSGNVTVLEALGRSRGFAVTAVPPVRSATGVTYSSTQVRTCLVEGRPRDAAWLLGRYFEVEGRVEYGDQWGRWLGYPTANLYLGEYQKPRIGVYAVRVGLDKRGETLWQNGVANYGYRPSVEGRTPLLEVHLLDFAENIYRRRLRVALVEFLRPERRFDGLEALRAQIATDVAQARTILHRLLLSNHAIALDSPIRTVWESTNHTLTSSMNHREGVRGVH